MSKPIIVKLSDVERQHPPTEVELAYRRGYTHGVVAAKDLPRRVSQDRIANWLDRLESWRGLARMAKLRGQQRCPQSPPPTLGACS